MRIGREGPSGARAGSCHKAPAGASHGALREFPKWEQNSAPRLLQADKLRTDPVPHPNVSPRDLKSGDCTASERNTIWSDSSEASKFAVGRRHKTMPVVNRLLWQWRQCVLFVHRPPSSALPDG